MILLGFILGIVFCAVVFFACASVLGDDSGIFIFCIILAIAIVAFVIYSAFGNGGAILIAALQAIN